MQKILTFIKEHCSTLILRGAIAVLAGLVLLVCILLSPAFTSNQEAEQYRLLVVGIYAAAVLFYAAAVQALKLLSYIDQNRAFSSASIHALRNIRNAAFVMAAVFTATLPEFYSLAQYEDAPGLMAIGLLLTFASVVVGVFAAVLQKLLQSGQRLKSENDLTV